MINKDHTILRENDRRRISITLFDNALNRTLAESVLIESIGATRYRDAYHIRDMDSEVFLFDYGVLVGWNISEEQRKSICTRLSPVFDDDISFSSIEQYSYSVNSGSEFNVSHDHLSLTDHELLSLLALSHAFAQSAKLEFFENKAQKMIHENAFISRELAQKGKVMMSRRSLAKLRGVLFDTTSDITLHFNLLDTPEFFWDYPQLEASYDRLSKYLDLDPRIEILNIKLDTIQKLLDMLAAEQYHKHSSFLEWVIIILIMVDIIIYFLE